MKKLSLLLSVFILAGLAIPAYAITFDVSIEPGNTFVHPDDGLTYYKANTDLYMEIAMGNNDGIDWTGWSMCFRIYAKVNGVETDDVPITWIDAGGDEQAWVNGEGSIVGQNGWPDIYFGMFNEIYTFSWDGSLPDTMNHTTASMTGWPVGDPELPRIRFHFSVPTFGIDPETDVVEICIDQSGYPDPVYTWDFPWPLMVDFGGPYCFNFLNEMVIPPSVVAPPQLTTSHSTPFELNTIIQCDEWLPISNVCAIDNDDNPIGTATIFNEKYLNWTFDPPCSWINDGINHYVFFYVESEATGMYCPTALETFSALIVTEGQPEILDSYESEALGKIDETNQVNIEMSPTTTDVETWSYEVDPIPTGTAGITDGVLSFTPTVDDDGINYVFTIRATDCTGNYDECDVVFWARSEYLCGDPNEDSEVNILDVVYIVNAIYKGGPGPGPLEISDINGDGSVNILDVVHFINFKYKGGPSLNCPE